MPLTKCILRDSGFLLGGKMTTPALLFIVHSVLFCFFFQFAHGIIKFTCRASEKGTIGINRDIKRANSHKYVSVALYMQFK